MVVPTSNRPFISARCAVSLIPPGQALADIYTLIIGADANAGATQLNLAISEKNGAAAAATDRLELEDDHQIWLPSSAQVVSAAAHVIGNRKLILDNGSGGNPSIAPGDFIRFANHTTIYRVGRVNGQAIRIFPTLTAPVADNEVVTVFQEVRLNLGANQVVDIDTSGVDVNVASLQYPIVAASSDTLAVREEKQIFGLTTLGASPTINSIDASDTRSPVKDFITGSGLTAVIETLAMEAELARPEIILGTLLNTKIVATTGFFLNVRTAAGEIYQGPASPSESSSTNTKGNLETFNINFSFNLDSTKYWLAL